MVRKFPVALGYTLAAVLDAVIASGWLHWGNDQKAAVITIVTAVFTLVSALKARPVEVGVVSATLTTAVTALAAFKLDLSGDLVQIWLTAIVAVAALLTHGVVSPVGGVLDRDPTTRPAVPVD